MAPMSDPADKPEPSSDQVEHGEIINPPAEETDGESVSSPAKVMRVGSMIKQLLEEVRDTELDEAARDRLRGIYEKSIRELATALSPDLQDELERLTLPFDEDIPSGAELRVAKGQLVGWLEGLFHGIQATLFAQQMEARQQLETMRGRLPAGAQPPQGAGGPEGPEGAEGAESRPGTYL